MGRAAFLTLETGAFRAGDTFADFARLVLADTGAEAREDAGNEPQDP